MTDLECMHTHLCRNIRHARNVEQPRRKLRNGYNDSFNKEAPGLIDSS